MEQPIHRWTMSLSAAVALWAGMQIPALAQEQAVPPAPPSKTVQGEVIDPSAYLREGRHGPEAVDQTYEAVDGGQSLALLEDGTNTLYLFLTESPGEDPNELVYDYVNQRVLVTGRIYQQGELHGIVPLTVEPVTPPAPAPVQAPSAPSAQ